MQLSATSNISTCFSTVNAKREQLGDSLQEYNSPKIWLDLWETFSKLGFAKTTIILLYKIIALVFYHYFQPCHFPHQIYWFPNQFFKVQLVPRFLSDGPTILPLLTTTAASGVLANYISWHHFPYSHCCLHTILHPLCLKQSSTFNCQIISSQSYHCLKSSPLPGSLL